MCLQSDVLVGVLSSHGKSWCGLEGGLSVVQR